MSRREAMGMGAEDEGAPTLCARERHAGALKASGGEERSRPEEARWRARSTGERAGSSGASLARVRGVFAAPAGGWGWSRSPYLAEMDDVGPPRR